MPTHAIATQLRQRPVSSHTLTQALEEKETGPSASPPQSTLPSYVGNALNALRQCRARPMLTEAVTLPLTAADIANHMMDGTGTAFGKILAKMSVAAKRSTEGRSQIPWVLRHKLVLVTHPEDIDTLLKKKIFIEHDVTGIFEMALGGKTTFSLDPNDLYRRNQRERLVTNLYHSSRHTQTIQQTLCDALETLSPGEAVPLYRFANHIALDVIARTQLAANHLSARGKDRISDVIDRISTTLTNPVTHLQLGISACLPSACKSWIMPTLQALTDEANQILQEEILAPHPDTPSVIAEKWLSENEEDRAVATLTVTKMIVMAGHETTTKLLFFALMILGDSAHQEKLEKIRKEIEERKQEAGKPVSEWSLNDFLSLRYLDAFLMEVLRLYPPIPDILFGVSAATEFADGMLYPGDTVAICPRFTHKLTEVYGEDAMMFNPDRFYYAAEPPSGSTFFPFGISSRKDKVCPGRHLALLEARQAIVMMAERFDLEASHTVNHETDYYQMITMHVRDALEAEATLRLTPRNPDFAQTISRRPG